MPDRDPLLAFLRKINRASRNIRTIEFEIKWKTKSRIFIARGMKRYARSYKPKLILGVYIIPGAVMGLLMYLAQYG